MNFKKDSIWLLQMQIVLLLMLASSVCVIIIGIRASKILVFLGIFFYTGFSGTLLLVTYSNNEYIKINETGILCYKSGETLWQYSWEQIAELRLAPRNKLPAVEIITFDRNGNANMYAGEGEYFYLGKEAKKSLKLYYKNTLIRYCK